MAPSRHSSLGTAGESVSLSGWTLGGGMEYAVSHNFTVRAEYRYTDFGDVSVDFDNVNVTMPVEVETHALRIGAGWKF